MVQMLEAPESMAETFRKAITNTVGGFAEGLQQRQQNQAELNLQMKKEAMKNQQKMQLLEQLGLISPSQKQGDQLSGKGQSSLGLNNTSHTQQIRDFSDEDIIAMSLVEPNVSKALQERQKTRRKEFEGDRTYHTNFSKSAAEKASKIRDSVSKKGMALALARNAVESGNLGFFSKDKLADITGIDALRTAKGAQLITAGKENLLSNLGRVSARANNLWFEQRLNSMFPKIGQSKEANLTTQEMLEADEALDKVYLNEYDRLREEDEQRYGYEKKDIEKRTHDAIKGKEKEIFNRTNYRLKEIEEREQGESKLKKSVGKNVIKGTPLTLQMAKFYKDKFGEKALQVAKKNGYHIPTVEEFKIYQMRPMEYGEQLKGEDERDNF